MLSVYGSERRRRAAKFVMKVQIVGYAIMAVVVAYELGALKWMN